MRREGKKGAARMKRNTARRPLTAVKRTLALVLAMLICAQLLPLGLSAKASATLTSDAEALAALSWTNLTVPTVSEGEITQNTYIFEVSSGTKSGGGSFDNVLYFAISYTTSDGLQRTSVILPNEDGISSGFERAAAVGGVDARVKLISDSFGYENPIAAPKLNSMQTSQMLFTTAAPISTIDKIQVFGKKLTSGSEWPCQGMRIYRVDRLYGLDMYGWYSNQGYVDFGGEIIAETEMDDGAGIFQWHTSGGMFNITPEDGDGTPGIRLLTSGGNVGRQISSRREFDSYVFRMDIADLAKAGFDALAYSNAFGRMPDYRDTGFTECAALVVRYKDSFGDTREVSLPLIMNALGQAITILGDNAKTAGFAQQGDSIAFCAMLPMFSEMVSVNLALGKENAEENAGLRLTAAKRDKTISDSISYLCVAVYKNADVALAMDGATLRYRYRSDPFLYNTAPASGILCEAGKTTTIPLQAWRDSATLTPVDRQERYLITVYTDNVANAGTTSDILLRFQYTSMKDKETESADYNVRDYVNAFYGEWSGSTDDFAYNYGFRQGGTVSFIIPLQDVKEFKNATFRGAWKLTPSALPLERCPRAARIRIRLLRASRKVHGRPVYLSMTTARSIASTAKGRR